MGKMAVLVDGAFYLKRAKSLKGQKSPSARADELVRYCRKHADNEHADIYRVFYYDCDPIGKKAFHPFLGRTVDLGKTEDYEWKKDFFAELARKRKFAIRKGESLDGSCEYVMKHLVSRELALGKRSIDTLSEDDFVLDIQQKGVDVRIGLDLALIAHERFC